LPGTDGNYAVAQPLGITVNISPASLTITGASAQDKPLMGIILSHNYRYIVGAIAPDV
jgi:Na+/serine symporter